MPKKVSSAARQARSSQRKRLQNQRVKNRIRTGLTRFAELSKKETSKAKAYGAQVVSWLDRSVKNGVFHRNTANRYKTRILASLKKLST